MKTIKTLNVMIKTNKKNKKSGSKHKVVFLFLTRPTDPWCYMLQTLERRRNMKWDNFAWRTHSMYSTDDRELFRIFSNIYDGAFWWKYLTYWYLIKYFRVRWTKLHQGVIYLEHTQSFQKANISYPLIHPYPLAHEHVLIRGSEMLIFQKILLTP